MAKENIITQENFDLLLSWLDPNRETAGQKYEKIRRRLIRILIGRGCFEAEQLADEIFDRVTRKLPELADNYSGDPSLYFYGVAGKIHLEWLRQQKKMKQLPLPETVDEDKSADLEYECLQTCLEKLPSDQRHLIVGYYKEEKSTRIENRRKLADFFGMSANALHVKTLRIRTQLRECLRNCITDKSSV